VLVRVAAFPVIRTSSGWTALSYSRAELQPCFAAAFDAMMDLFDSTEPISVRTEWFELREAVLQIRPYTRPRMPIARVTGIRGHPRTDRAARRALAHCTAARAGLRGVAWATVEAGAAEAGLTADRSQIRLNTIIHLAETRGQAFEEVREGAAGEVTRHSYELLARYVFPEFQGGLEGVRFADAVARALD